MAVPFDAAFDVEDPVDAPDRFGRDRRDDRRALAALQLGGGGGKIEELAPGMPN